MDEVLEVAELDAGVDEIESGAEQVEEGAEEVESAEQQADPAAKDDPYTTKYSREMRAALKAWETANPEQAKFAKQARDNHARLFALSQLEPKGIDGVREKYALLDGLTHGDMKGIEAVTAMREQVASIEETDSKIAAGDPSALEAFGPDFDAGLAKLAPAILDRVLKSDPATFDSIVLPRMVSHLAESPLVKEFNALIDVLNAQNDPRFDDKTKAAFTRTQLAKMGEWLNSISQKAGTVKAAVTPDGSTNTVASEQAKLETERRELHWERSIYPDAGKAVRSKFDELLAPYQKRLRLTPKQIDSAFADFKSRNTKLCDADKDYDRQIKSYRSQKAPDPKQVLNSVRAQLIKTAKSSFDEVKDERWGAFLNAKPTVKNGTNGNGGKPLPPAGPGVEIRSVKPPMSEIDHQRTPIAWLAQKKYYLTNGKIVQIRPNVQ